MDSGEARREAEAARYRTQVRLALVARTGEKMGHPGAALRAKELHARASGIDFGSDPSTSLDLLEEIGRELIALEEQVGIEEAKPPLFPKWVRYTAWTMPALGVLAATLFVLERRRRFKEIDAAAIERLEKASSRAESRAESVVPLGRAPARPASGQRWGSRPGTDKIRPQ